MLFKYETVYIFMWVEGNINQEYQSSEKNVRKRKKCFVDEGLKHFVKDFVMEFFITLDRKLHQDSGALFLFSGSVYP